MKYKVNDIVMYDARKVCRITDVSTKNVKGNSVEYYMLKLLYDDKAVIFVPVGNEATAAKMRPVLAAEAIDDLFGAISEKDALWADEEAARKAQCKAILDGGDRAELLSLIRTLHMRRQDRLAKGRQPSVGDNYMKEAERVLHEEFVYVFNIEHNEVLPFILRRIQGSAD